MRTTDFTRIFASSPINKTAGTVASGSGDCWEPKPNLGNYEHWENPPPTIDPNKYPKASDFTDLRGVEMGRFTVVGYLGKPNPKRKTSWLLRCSCGHYESRKTRAIKENNNPQAMCKNCEYQERLRNNPNFKAGVAK